MKQPPLFDGPDAGAALLPVAVPVIPGDGRALSAVQRRFNTLLGQIDTLRREHQRWRVFMDAHHRRVVGDFVPEVARLRESQIALVRLFDAHVNQSRLNKRDRETVRELLLDLLDDLLQEEETPELISLYEVHAGVDLEEDKAQEFETMRAMASILPVDVDAYQGERDPEAFADWLDQQLGGGREVPPGRPGRERKTRAKTKTDRSQPQPPLDDGAIALRKMFRSLASTLHPDRESDPQEQRRKTVLMQELNAAYAAGDLLRLLELRHAVDASSAALHGLTDVELKPYIQLLQAQAKKLRDETDTLLAPLASVFPGQPVRSLTIPRIEKTLAQEIAGLKRTRRDVDADLKRFADVDALKDFVAQIRREEADARRTRSAGRRKKR